MRLLLALLLLVLIIPVSQSARMTSGNYTVVTALDGAGGPVYSASNKAVFSVEPTFGVANLTATKVCVGYICVEFGPSGQIISVTFMLEGNIAGASGDVGHVDQYGTGLYKTSDISKYFTCIEDTSVSGSPVFGIINAGSALRYIRLDPGSSYAMRVSEQQPGNKFIIPVTGGGCDIIKGKFPLTLPMTPFVLTEDVMNAIEMIINYPFDIVGDFEKSGSFTLVLEKNDTEIIGSIV